MVSTSYLVKFGADSKSVSSAIKDINSEMRALNATSRNLSSSFKFTGDTRILDSQLKVLGQQLELAKEKSAGLKSQLASMKGSPGFDENSKGARNLQNQIMKADSEVTKFSSEIKKTSSLKLGGNLKGDASEISSKLDSAGNNALSFGRKGKAGFESVENAGRKGLGTINSGLSTSKVALGSFIGNLGAIGVSAGMRAVGTVFDGLGGEIISSSDALDKFQSTMKFAGKSSSEIDKVTTASKKYADDTVYDLQTITSTTAQLAANGVDNYEKLMEASGNLNAVAGGNADTFKSVSMVLTQTAGAGKLTTENWNQLADAIPGASGRLQEAMLKNGAYTGNFRDAMEKGQISAGEFNKAIMDLGMEDAAKKAATSTSTFEGAFGNLQAAFVTAGDDFLNRFKGPITSGMTAVAEAVPGMSKAFGDFLDGLGPIFSQAGQAMQPMIDYVKTNFGPLFKTVTDNWQSELGAVGDFLSPFFKNMWKSVQALLGGFHINTWAQGLMKEIGGTDTSEAKKALSDPINGLNNAASNVNLSPVTAALGSLKDFAKGVMDIVGKINLTPLFTEIGKLGNSLVSSLGGVDFGAITKPISDAVGSISDGLGKLDFSGLNNFVQALLPAISEGVKNFLDWVTPALDPLVQSVVNLWNALQPVFDVLANSLGPVFQVLGDVLGGFVSGVMQGITGAFNLLADTVKLLTPAIQFLGSVFNALAPILGTVGGWIGNLIGQFEGFGGVFGKIGDAFKTVWQGVGDFFGGFGNTVVGIIDALKGSFNGFKQAFGAVRDFFGQAIEAIKGFFSSMGKAFSSLGDAFGKIGESMKRGFKSIGDLFQQVVNFSKGVFEGWKNMFGSVRDFFINAGQQIGQVPSNILNFFRGLGDKIANTVKDGPSKIISFFAGLPNKIWNNMKDITQVGKNIVIGIWNGMASKSSWLWNTINNWANDVVKGIKRSFGIHSPSKVMRDEVGKFLTQGVGVGMVNETNSVKKDADKVKSAIVGQFSGTQINPDIGLNSSGALNSPVTTSNNTLTFNISGSDPTQNANEVRRVLRQERLI